MTTPPAPLNLEPCVLGGDIFKIPRTALTQEKVFRHVFSDKTWKNLPDEDRTRLRKLLPKGENKEQDSAVHKLFTLQNIKFGNPLKHFHKSLKRNHLNPETYYYRQLKKRSMYKAYKQSILQQHTESLQMLLLLREKYLEQLQGLTEEDMREKLNPSWRNKARAYLNLPVSEVDGNAKALYRKVLDGVKDHCRDDYSSSSEGEDSDDSSSDVDVPALLTAHYRRRVSSRIAPTLDTRGTTIIDVIDRTLNDKHDSDEEQEVLPPPAPAQPPPAKKPKLKSTTQPEKKAKVKAVKEEQTSTPSTVRTVSTLVPYQNVLVLLRAIMSSSSTLSKELSEEEICEEINRWQETEVAKLCPWASIIHDWTLHIRDILVTLSEHESNALLTSTPAGMWRWCSDVDDSKQRLNAQWEWVLDNVPSLALIMGEIKGLKAEDERPESQHGETFHQQEAMRFAHPHRCFTYRLNGREYLVGPVKGVYEKLPHNSTNKAREHVLLVNDRPSYVTILTLVRDAAARLPKGEGTRYEICDLLQQSQFISNAASVNHINTVVSGALDRLHYEKDPCVKFDSARKNWIYLHGDRTAEELEMLHQAQGAALKAKKAAKPSKSAQAAANAAAAANADSEKTTSKSSKSSAPFLSMQAETQLAEQSIMDTGSGSSLLPPASTAVLAKASSKVQQMRPVKVDAQQKKAVKADSQLMRPVKVETQHMRPVKVETQQMRPVKVETQQMRPTKGESQQTKAVKVEQTDDSRPTSGPTRLISMQFPSSIGQMRGTSAAVNRQLSAPAAAEAAQSANQSWTAGEGTPTLIHSSSLPKGAVVYQRIPSTHGQASSMMQKVLSGSPTTGAGKALSGNSALMHRIVGNASGTPVLARLVPTQGSGKVASAEAGGSQQQLAHLQLPGGDNVALPSRAVQLVSGSGVGQGRANMLQVQNVGGVRSAGGVNRSMSADGSSRPVTSVTMSMGGVTKTLSGVSKNVATTSTFKTSAQQSVTHQVKLSNLQQQLGSMRSVSGASKASLLTGQSDGRGGQVQLVKALITSSEGKPGSQAYILTSNSGQRGAVVTTKPSTVTSGHKSAMIARVLQPDGTLTAVKSGRVTTMPAGGKSILTNMAGGIRNPLIVRQVNASGQLAAAQQGVRVTTPVITTAAGQLKSSQVPSQTPTAQSQQLSAAVRSAVTSGGEIPKKIEHSELSPSTELDVESDM